MEKVFEALELVDKMANYILLDEEYGFIDDEEKQAIIKDRETIKQALTELKQIKEAKPSEALKGLEFICKILNEKGIDVKWLFKNDYNTIKQALLKAQEQEKVLEIVFKKQVDISIIYYSQNVDDYNNSIVFKFKPSALEQCKLTQEEFDTLKRGCEK